MARGGTRKVVLLPMGIKIDGVRYEDQLIIGEHSFQKSHLKISHDLSEVKLVSMD